MARANAGPVTLTSLDPSVPARPVAPTFDFSPAMVVITEPTGERAEAIRALRTNIMARHVDEGRRALAVCAASPGVGCTFIAANLAVALSQSGLKTLLIDADMRQPGIDRMIRSSGNPPGLQQHLGPTSLTLGDVVQEDVAPNLSVIFAGGVAPNPQELLAGERFATMMDRCLRDYDVTIVDTPPANSCADARRVSTVVGYSLVVALRDESRVSDVGTLVSQLREERGRVIGTVLSIR
jgi:capsular exopolysaccharide synthesis family protein